MTYYNSTACENVISPSDLRYTQLTGYNCPDMPPDSTINLQGTLALPIMSEDQKWFTMIVGTCHDLSSLTKQTNCVSDDYVTANLQYMYNLNKLLTMYVNFSSYPKTGVNEYQSYNDLQAFAPNTNVQKTYNMMRSQVVLKDQWFMASIGAQLIDYYMIEYTDFSFFNALTYFQGQTAASKITGDTYYKSYLNYDVVQATTQWNYDYHRTDVMHILLNIGSIMFSLTRLSGKIIGRFQAFSIENSMISKLYTKKTDKEVNFEHQNG